MVSGDTCPHPPPPPPPLPPPSCSRCPSVRLSHIARAEREQSGREERGERGPERAAAAPSRLSSVHPRPNSDGASPGAAPPPLTIDPDGVGRKWVVARAEARVRCSMTSARPLIAAEASDGRMAAGRFHKRRPGARRRRRQPCNRRSRPDGSGSAVPAQRLVRWPATDSPSENRLTARGNTFYATSRDPREDSRGGGGGGLGEWIDDADDGRFSKGVVISRDGTRLENEGTCHVSGRDQPGSSGEERSPISWDVMMLSSGSSSVKTGSTTGLFRFRHCPSETRYGAAHGRFHFYGGEWARTRRDKGFGAGPD